MSEGTTDPNWVIALANNCVSYFSLPARWEANVVDDDKLQALAQLTADVAVALKQLLPFEVTTVEAALAPVFLHGDGDDLRSKCVQTFSISVPGSLERAPKVAALAEQIARVVIAQGGTSFFPYILLIPLPPIKGNTNELYYTRLTVV